MIDHSHQGVEANSYWLTLHWPPREQGENNVVDVWLPNGREHAGAALAPGDLVLVYESGTGRTEVRINPDGARSSARCLIGRQGIVGLCRVQRCLQSDGNERPTDYADGTSIWWRWRAPTEVISTAGFAPRAVVNEVLNYRPHYNFRGFGDGKSGLKRLSREQFLTLLSALNSVQHPAVTNPAASRSTGPHGNGVESEEHRLLKEFVAGCPSRALHEQGLVHHGTEFEFDTGDRADVYLHDAFERVVGVEVKVSVGPGDWAGPLQALKYRSLLEFVADRPRGEGRAILVAYSIDPQVRDKCHRFGIECHEVSHERVQSWLRQRAPA